MLAEPVVVDHEALSPLQRLHLRDALQDMWRDQVCRITELSVELHDALRDVYASGTARLLPRPVTAAVVEARFRLTEIERAMQRLDDRTYGRCTGCGTNIPFEALALRPEVEACSDCHSAPRHAP